MSTITYERELFNREHKSSAFTAYFGEPENAVDLYRALSHMEDATPDDIEYQTLQGVMFMARKNDMAFTVHKRVLVLSEHQSTVNENMPLRSAIYYGRTMEKLIPPRSIYKTGLIRIPTPEFYTFYNGSKSQPPEKILRLSDAYLEKTDTPMLQLIVKMINMNPAANHPILEKSHALNEYAQFVQIIRDHMKNEQNRDAAILKAMEACVRQGIMVDFIRKYGSEVRNMLFTEFNMEDALEVCGEENFERGIQEGIRQGICSVVKLCEECGFSREKTIGKLCSEFNLSEEEAAAYIDNCRKPDIAFKQT